VDGESVIGPRTDTPYPPGSWILAPDSFPSHGIGAMGTTLRRVILCAVRFEHEGEHSLSAVADALSCTPLKLDLVPRPREGTLPILWRHARLTASRSETGPSSPSM